MTTDVTASVLIRRPRPGVAAYMFDPGNDAEWTTGVESVRPHTPGPLRTGSRVDRSVRFLGRRFGYTYEVTAAEPGHSVEMAVEVPFPMRIRYQLDDEGGATRASIRARGEPRGFSASSAPSSGPWSGEASGRTWSCSGAGWRRAEEAAVFFTAERAEAAERRRAHGRVAAALTSR